MVAERGSRTRRIAVSARDFSLDETLNSAQVFRCWPENGGYMVQAWGRHFHVRQTGDRLEARDAGGLDEAFLVHFFALDENHAALRGRLSQDTHLRPALEVCQGLRILRQDPWECLVGFVCSSCCNVPRIRRVVNAICNASGDGQGFPEPGQLPDEPALRRLGAGYRARYLHAANRPHMRPWLDGLRMQAFAVARRRLMALAGVGGKVADCVLLYGLGFGQAFPVDVWVRRAVQHVYFGGREVPTRQIHAFAADRFGTDAGYAQQVLFHAWRTRRPS